MDQNIYIYAILHRSVPLSHTPHLVPATIRLLSSACYFTKIPVMYRPHDSPSFCNWRMADYDAIESYVIQYNTIQFIDTDKLV